MIKCKFEVEGILGMVEAWYDRTRWNGHPQPMMTETQLDALIKAQNPEANDRYHDKIFFDKKEGFSIKLAAENVVEPLQKVKLKTPKGEMLYDIGLCWCWKLNEVEVV